VAERDEEKVLIEFKYLKKATDQRLIKDMIKLALSSNPSHTRLLLVAHSPVCQNRGQSRSTLVRALASAGQPTNFRLTQCASQVVEVVRDQRIKLFLTSEEGKHASRIMTYDPLLTSFAAEHVASCQNASENVSVFSVSRI